MLPTVTPPNGSSLLPAPLFSPQVTSVLQKHHIQCVFDSTVPLPKSIKRQLKQHLEPHNSLQL